MNHPLIDRVYYSAFFLMAIVMLWSVFADVEASMSKIRIVDKPIDFSKRRIALTCNYIKLHYDDTTCRLFIIRPQVIVIHWTAAKTLQASFNSMYPIEKQRKVLSRYKFMLNRVNVSAHYLVDRDGTIYQLMPDNWMGIHVIGLNPVAIGIENVGGVKGKPDLTEAQLKANEQLVRYLKYKYPKIKYVIGHYEYLNFENSSLWYERDPHYRTRKVDPGKDFIEKLRTKLQN